MSEQSVSNLQRIAFLISGQEPRDVLEHIFLLALYLSAEKDIHVITPHDIKHAGIEYLEKIKASRAHLHVLHSPQITSTSTLMEIRQLIQNQNIQILHVHDAVAAQGVQKLKKNLGQLLSVATFFDAGSFQHLGLFKRKSMKKIFQTFDRTVAVSQHIKELMLQHYAIRDPFVIYPGVEHQLDNERRTREQIILYVGPLTREQGVTDLMRAFGLMCRGRPWATLMFVGRGPLHDRLICMAEDMKVGHRVVVTENQIGLSELFKKAAVFVMPCYQEQISQSLITALSMSKPVVVSKTQSHCECLVGCATEIFVKPNDVFRYAIVIKKILDEPEFRQSLSQQVQHVFESKFHVQTMIEKHKMVYQVLDRTL